MPLKINMFNNHLRMQLLRLTLLFNGYLIGDDEQQVLKLFSILSRITMPIKGNILH